MTTDLRALAERLEKATQNDAALFLDVYDALLPPIGTAPHSEQYISRRHHFMAWCGYGAFLDAAVALCERVLPGWIHGHEHTGDPAIADAWVRNPWNDTDAVEALGCTPALALCLAVVRAKLAEAE